MLIFQRLVMVMVVVVMGGTCYCESHIRLRSQSRIHD